MNRLYMLLTAIFLTSLAWAQAPQKMSYQAVVRDASNGLMINQKVGIKISLLQESVSGDAVYVETHTPTTNDNGLLSIEIGAGTLVLGSLTIIDWSEGPYFIHTETDPTGGTNYTITGTSQLLSVPYALHAQTAENITGDIAESETDPLFSKSIASSITATDTAKWNNSNTTVGAQLDSAVIATMGYVAGPKTIDTKLDETAVDSFVANNGYLTQEKDSSVTNEIELPTGGNSGQILSTDGSGTYSWIDAGAGGLVADAINDSITAIAPSQNAVFDGLALKAPIADPTFTGTPKVPTAASGTNTTQIATTAFVEAAVLQPGTAKGQITYWNDTAWVVVAPGTSLPGNQVQTLVFCNGVPTWGTCPAVVPTLSSTAAASSITGTTASSGGVISNDGGASVTARGVAWSTSTGPTISGSHTTGGLGSIPWPFEDDVTGLSVATTYYVRAYATNSAGTAYGPEISFTTSAMYLDKNDITFKVAEDGEIGESFYFDGETYLLVDSTMLYNMVAANEDVTKVITSRVTNFFELFRDNSSFNQDISSWDVSKVTDMYGMFSSSIFNQEINNWNVSNVTKMGRLFYNATFFNQDISNWDVSNVTEMTSMFLGTAAAYNPFNQDITFWDVTSVIDMSGMFGSSVFDQDISNWDVSNVIDMTNMFIFASYFNQDLSSWNISNVTECSGFSYEASAWTLNQPIFTNCTP